MFLTKKWGILIKRESESLVFTGLEIPRDYLFGKEFTRTTDSPVNAALNYGYTLVLSMISREIVANGYITQLGLFHDNMFNQFNLASDIMEPYRAIVDEMVVEYKFEQFDVEEKHYMIRLFEREVMIGDKSEYIPNAIKIYVKSVFDALNENDVSLIKFYRSEL